MFLISQKWNLKKSSFTSKKKRRQMSVKPNSQKIKSCTWANFFKSFCCTLAKFTEKVSNFFSPLWCVNVTLALSWFDDFFTLFSWFPLQIWFVGNVREMKSTWPISKKLILYLSMKQEQFNSSTIIKTNFFSMKMKNMRRTKHKTLKWKLRKHKKKKSINKRQTMNVLHRILAFVPKYFRFCGVRKLNLNDIGPLKIRLHFFYLH